MRVRVAGLVDECPGASTKGAKGAEGEGHVVVVQSLVLDDGPVVLVLLAAVLVGRETTLLRRLLLVRTRSRARESRTVSS